MEKNFLKYRNELLKNYFAMDDFLFLKYMGEKGNELQQKSFLKSLGININGEIRVSNTKMPPDKRKGKQSELDSRIITECGKDINIEIQRQKTEDFLERLIIYTSKRLIEPIGKGKNYKKNQKGHSNSYMQIFIFKITKIP